jgi:hypothetical protein
MNRAKKHGSCSQVVDLVRVDVGLGSVHRGLSGREAADATLAGELSGPRELTEFELPAFFTYSSTERAVIERGRGPAMKLGLALHRCTCGSCA